MSMVTFGWFYCSTIISSITPFCSSNFTNNSFSYCESHSWVDLDSISQYEPVHFHVHSTCDTTCVVSNETWTMKCTLSIKHWCTNTDTAFTKSQWKQFMTQIWWHPINSQHALLTNLPVKIYKLHCTEFISYSIYYGVSSTNAILYIVISYAVLYGSTICHYFNLPSLICNTFWWYNEIWLTYMST